MNIERMRQAVAFLSTVPASQWNMDLYYFSPNKCGCALGHLAKNEVAGFTMEQSTPRFYGPDFIGTGMGSAIVGFDLEHDDAMFLFGRVGILPGAEISQPSHKALFFKRLTHLLLTRDIPLSAVFGPSETHPGQETPHYKPGETEQRTGHEHAVAELEEWTI